MRVHYVVCTMEYGQKTVGFTPIFHLPFCIFIQLKGTMHG